MIVIVGVVSFIVGVIVGAAVVAWLGRETVVLPW